MEETKKRPELDMALNTIFVIQDPEKGTIMDKKGTDDIRATVQKVLENKTNKASKPDLVAARVSYPDLFEPEYPDFFTNFSHPKFGFFL